MKKVALVFLTLAATAQAQAKLHTLSCFNIYGKSAVPLMTASMVSDTTLRDIKFTTPDSNQELANSPGVSTGAMVVSNHSPYKGAIQYNLPGGLFLLLPASLVNDDLEATLTDGIGYNKGENGVLIGNFTGGDSDGGTHFSYRLKCNSDK